MLTYSVNMEQIKNAIVIVIYWSIFVLDLNFLENSTNNNNNKPICKTIFILRTVYACVQ